MIGHDDGQPQLPRNTTPTWEVELLISGVAVFAMLQLPELLDNAILEWTPRVVDRWAKLLWAVYIYAKSAALILAVTFVYHLLLRARWIALVGMFSIYPKGVDWSRLRLGPHARDIESRRMGGMDTAIDRADNRATMVFALGVVVASILVGITIVAGACISLAWFLEARIGLSPDSRWIAWGTMIVMFPYFIAFFIDMYFGERMPADAFGTRVLRRVLAFYARTGFGMANNPALALLSSHRGQRWTMILMLAILSAASVTAVVSYGIARDPDAYGSYDIFPDSDDQPTRALDPAHYDDRRDPLRNASPYVQSAVVIGPYLQLVVPWTPDRDGPAMQRRCGTLPAEAQLACYAEHVRPLTLDGKRIAPVFDIGEDARTNRPALVTMIDVRDLPRGRHVLGVTLPQRTKKRDDDAPADFIPFWR